MLILIASKRGAAAVGRAKKNAFLMTIKSMSFYCFLPMICVMFRLLLDSLYDFGGAKSSKTPAGKNGYIEYLTLLCQLFLPSNTSFQVSPI